MKLDRRDFLKVSAGAAGAAGLLLLNPSSLTLAQASSSEDDVAMLVDVTKCVGCWWCYAACKEYNRLPETTKPDPSDPPPLAPDTWTTLYTVNNGSVLTFPRKLACNHCTDAACVKVCPTGALSYNEKGFVQYDRSKCSGCGYCVEFCPFDIPQLERNRISGDAKMYKCTFCKERVADGEQPACAAACPEGAIKFGKRSDLLQEGAAAVAALIDTKPNAVLYGENELGGLHVMYVLDDSPDTYGLPVDPEVSSAVTVRDILKWLGVGATGAVLAGFGLNYMIARKMLASEPAEGESTQESEGEDAVVEEEKNEDVVLEEEKNEEGEEK